MKEEFKSVLAGMLIALGCESFINLKGSYLGALLFSLGLLSIASLNLNLFTGKCGKVINYKGQEKYNYINFLIKIIIYNFIGCIIIHIITPHSQSSINYVNSLLLKKYSYNPLEVIGKGILCGMLVHLGVEGFKKNNEKTNGAIILIMSVVTFLLNNYEHCIADFYYLLYQPFSLISILYIIYVIIGNILGAILLEVLM